VSDQLGLFPKDMVMTAVHTGTQEEVDYAVVEYYSHYPKDQYETQVTRGPVDLGGGLWEARMTRRVGD